MRHRTSYLLVAILLFSSAIVQADDHSFPPIKRITKSSYSKFFVTYSPDGSRLVYSRHHDNRRAANKILMGLRIVNSDGTDDRALMPEFDSQVQIQEHAEFSPDGKQLFLTGGGNDTGNAAKDIFVCDIDASYRASNLRKLSPNGPKIGEQPGISPDGREIVVTDPSHNLWIVSTDGPGKRKLIQSAGNYCFQQTWSPDGEWIAFTSDRDGNAEIYKIRTDGTDLIRLTDDPAFDCRPRWAPDGRWLAFVSNRSGNEEIHVMRDDGSDVRRLTDHPDLDDHPAWQPDGKFLSFVSMRDGGFDLYRMQVPVDLQIGPKPRLREQSTTPTGDLVAYYNFDDDRGNQIKDRAGRNTMTISQALLVSQNGRGCLRFDGQTSFASIGNALSLQLFGPMTFSLWLKLDSVQGNGYVISKQGFNLYVGPDLIPRFETRNATDTTWLTLPAKTVLSAGKWNYVACVFNPDEKSSFIYVNGALSGQMERTDGKLGAVESFPLEFGHYVASKTQKLKGELDEIQFYRRALSAQEIASQFAEQRPRVGIE